jgi:hypothetical protein
MKTNSNMRVPDRKMSICVVKEFVAKQIWRRDKQTLYIADHYCREVRPEQISFARYPRNYKTITELHTAYVHLILGLQFLPSANNFSSVSTPCDGLSPARIRFNVSRARHLQFPAM